MILANNNRTENGYPLKLEVTKIEYVETEYNKEFLLNLIPKINYHTLKAAIKDITPYMMEHHKDVVPYLELPNELQVNNKKAGEEEDAIQIDKDKASIIGSSCIIDEDSHLQNVYKALMDVHIMEGCLICPDTGRKFFISEGIPNMVLHEDEV